MLHTVRKPRGEGVIFFILYEMSQKKKKKQKDDTESIIFMTGTFPKQLIISLKKLKKHCTLVSSFSSLLSLETCRWNGQIRSNPLCTIYPITVHTYIHTRITGIWKVPLLVKLFTSCSLLLIFVSLYVSRRCVF